MDDGSGKCLLDVISDPSALSEFLKSNSQILVDGEDLSNTKTQTIQKFSVAGQKHKTRSVVDASGVSSTFSVSTAKVRAESAQQTTYSEQATTNDKLSKSSINSSTKNPFKNITTTVMSNVSRTFSHIAKPTGNLTPANIPASSITMPSASKGISTVGGTFQSKKPIPIQPKNQVIRPNTLLPTGMNMQSNPQHGIVPQTTPVVANQLQMTPPKVLPKTHVPVSVNGADKSRISQYQTLQPNRTVQGSAQVLTTPPKRIAPKQVLSPPLNPALAISSPMRMQQANIINKQKVQLPTHLLQAPATQVTTQSQTHLLQAPATRVTTQSQQINAIRHMAPSSLASPVQSTTAKPVQHVQQIQQLVHEKLGARQTPVQTNQIQHKVFTQAQLQAALKQSQLLAQNSPGQQNLIVQQQILKQLIQQAQLHQQKQSEKVQVNVQPSVVQLQQQQIVQAASPSVPISNANQQLTLPNRVAGSNQQVQMVMPNQQVVAIAQNTLSSNQQALNVRHNASNPSQQNLNQTLNVNNKQQIQVGRPANTTVTQPMMIVSQGNFVVQQSGQPLTTNATTLSGNSVNIQTIQNLINQQQQQIKVVNNVQQVNQAKPTNQNSTVYIQNVGGQGQSLKIQQGVNQPQGSGQQNVILQYKQPVASTQGGASTTIQQLTSAQVQQLQNLGAVQKVFIIKQPEILQKLGMQGVKQTQTIQITPQQLQALQHMQNQQNPNQQKIIIQNSSPGGSKTSTTVLSAQQVKQLHSLQQLAGSGKQGQSPQTLIQRQTLAQQLQKQLSSQQAANPKMAHIPRILQTTGRQPVATSQSSPKMVITIKQEPNRGIKRSHPETPEPPKVVTRLKSSLYQDQQLVGHPDIHTPFKSNIDAVNKLRCYHVYYDPDKTPKHIEKAEGLFNNVAGQLIKRSEKMIDKYRNLMLEESLRKEPSSEMVMLYRLFLADERAALAKEKKQIAEDLKALKNLVKVEVPSGAASTNLTQTVKQTVEIPQIKREPEKIVVETPPPVESKTKNIEYELDLLNTSIEMDSLGEDTHQGNVVEYSNVKNEASEIDKAVFNMETSSSVYYEPVNQLSNSLSPRTSVETTKEAEECIAALPMDDDDKEEVDDAEKEDVTATLALLHSMAEELADIS